MNETHIVTIQVSPLLDSSLPAAVRQVGSGCGRCSLRLHRPHPLPTWVSRRRRRAVLKSYRTFDIVEIERYDDLTIIPFVHYRRSSCDMNERVQTTVLECRREDYGPITYRSHYVNDLRPPPGRPPALHLMAVCSPYIHAETTSIQLDTARAQPGVTAAFEGAE